MIGAFADTSSTKRFVAAGADGYLTKPFSPEQLHAVIESLRFLIDKQIARVDLPASAAWPQPAIDDELILNFVIQGI